MGRPRGAGHRQWSQAALHTQLDHAHAAATVAATVAVTADATCNAGQAVSAVPSVGMWRYVVRVYLPQSLSVFAPSVFASSQHTGDVETLSSAFRPVCPHTLTPPLPHMLWPCTHLSLDDSGPVPGPSSETSKFKQTRKCAMHTKVEHNPLDRYRYTGVTVRPVYTETEVRAGSFPSLPGSPACPLA